MVSFSIIMPAYNAEKTLAASVQSVLDQTFADYELLLIDDRSKDETYSICEAFAAADDRIRLFRNRTNKGVAFTRNRGIDEARGQWIAFLDSDDLWQAKKLVRHLQFIYDTNAVISYTASQFIDAEGNPYQFVLHAVKELRYNELLRRNLMSCSSVVVERDILRKNKFPEGKLHEDYVVWLQIVRKTGVAYGLDEPLLTYRLAKSSRSGQRLRSGLMAFRSYRAAGYPSMPAALLTLRYAGHSIAKRVQLYQSRPL